MLISIETHITCDFQGGGGSGPPIPPLDRHMRVFKFSEACQTSCGTTMG